MNIQLLARVAITHTLCALHALTLWVIHVRMSCVFINYYLTVRFPKKYYA